MMENLTWKQVAIKPPKNVKKLVEDRNLNIC